MYAFGRKKRKNPTSKKWIGPLLNERVQILEPTQSEEDEGGFSQKYSLIDTIWGGMKPISHTAYRRWSSIENFEQISHEFTFRCNAFDNLNTQYANAFASSFDSIVDLSPLKDSIYLMVEKGSTNKGRLFKIRRMANNDENNEYFSILAEEIEEIGTGAVIGSDYIS